MLPFDSRIVLDPLLAVGWTPTRTSKIPNTICKVLASQPLLALHPAVATLQNLAGFHIGKVGTGRECATSDIEFDWNEYDLTSEDPDIDFTAWEKHLNTRLVQIAEVHHAHSQLLMASDGRCFSWTYGGISFEGDHLQQAIEHLLLGIRSRPMLEPGQAAVHLYGTRYQAGDPEIYLY